MEYVWAAPTDAKMGVDFSAWQAIFDASPVVQLTLLILLGMSCLSWAIIFQKNKQFKELSGQNKNFLEEFWAADSLDQVHSSLGKNKGGTLASVFEAAFQELKKLADARSNIQGGVIDPGQVAPKLAGIENISRAIRKATDIEISKMEAKTSFLATTGSTGPFIGLFGTVWGIMGAFHKIGATGAASLAVVAPGISEALIATAIGLAAAIPAVVAYTHFNSQIRKEELEMSNFSSDLLNIVKRNFFREE